MAGGGGLGENPGNKSDHGVQRNHGGAAVADKGQGQTDAHTHITDHLEDQGGGNAEADQTAHIVTAAHAHPNTPGDDQHQQNNGDSTTDVAQFFANGGEDIVCMRGVQRT